MARVVPGICIAALAALPVSAQDLSDNFESPTMGPIWSVPVGTATPVTAAGEPRIAGVPLFGGGGGVLRQAADGNTQGVHLALAGGPAADMTVEAWVFCDGNDGATKRGGYQGIVARASNEGTVHMIRLAWDPDQTSPGNPGDGWVKFQAHDGTSWDYLGIDSTEFGTAGPGYIVDGTAWQSGWHQFKITIQGTTVSAYVDDMDVPVATGTLSLALRNGAAGFYTYTSGDFAGYYDNFSASLEAPPQMDFDALIVNGTVYRDGESDPESADVGIRGDRIVAIGDLDGSTATRTIDATGLLVVPGFIDVHGHADGAGSQAAYLRQGVTTMVNGNCGISPVIATLNNTYNGLAGRLGTNYVGLIGHNQLRSDVGLSGVTPTASQMQMMKDRINAGMDAGAFGLSTGLIYNSGFNSTTEEIIELAAVVAQRGGIYTTHMRDEGANVLASVAEALRIGREGNIRVQISHVKCAGPQAWNLSDEFIVLVDDAIAEGVDVWMDQYPYIASQTSINAIIPDWAENAWASSVANQRPELEQGIRDLIAGRGGADKVYLISGAYARRYLSEVALSLSKDPEDVIIENIGVNGAAAIYFTMQEEDLRTFIVHPRVMMGSDGPTSAHPRGQGTFPRFWGAYARDLGFFDHRQSVLRTSTLAARQFRLVQQQRGRIDTGWYADIAILDPETVIDRATFEAPTLSPTGIPHVFVNGALAVNNGTYTGTLTGRVIRSYDSKATGTAYWAVQ